MSVYLITGGSGFLGINLVRYLLNRNHKVIVLDISDFNYLDVKDKVNFVRADIRNLSTLKNCFKNVDAVIHCAAALPLASSDQIYSTDVIGTKNVLEASFSNGIKRVVHVSSTAVYGTDFVNPTLENHRLRSTGHYGRAKILSERICMEYRTKGMCIPILRPKTFVGPERLGIFAIYFDWITSGKSIPIIGSGRNYYQLLDVEDLCECIELCLTKESKVVNDVFNVAAKDYSTFRDDFGYIIDKAGFGKKIVPTPEIIAINTLKFLDILNLSPIYNWVYETASKDSFVSIDKAIKKLDFAPRYSNKDTLLRNYNWYVKNKNLFYGEEGISHRTPWKQGFLNLIKVFF